MQYHSLPEVEDRLAPESAALNDGEITATIPFAGRLGAKPHATFQRRVGSVSSASDQAI